MHSVQLFDRVREHHNVIAISGIRSNAKSILHQVIQWIEHDVGKKLRCQISDRKTTPSHRRIEEIVTFEPPQWRLATGPTCKYQRKHRQSSPAGDTTLYELKCDFMVDGREILFDIKFQHPRILVRPPLDASECCVRSLADPARI